jgi:hypothetical protein
MDKYGKPPGDHLPDLHDAILEGEESDDISKQLNAPDTGTR